jgi:hypothetical protein
MQLDVFSWNRVDCFVLRPGPTPYGNSTRGLSQSRNASTVALVVTSETALRGE